MAIWLAVHLPQLSLESFAASVPDGPDRVDADTGARAGRGGEAGSGPDRGAAPPARRPVALLEGTRIAAVDRLARSLGVQPGLKRATALALAPQLRFGQADPVRDAEALRAVAHAALAFTPSVSIQPPSQAASTGSGAGADRPHTVLLELQASLRCFGGLPRIVERLVAALAPLGHRLHLVSAATPLGAALLARVHRRLDCDGLPSTVAALEAAPVWLLGPGRAHWDALQGMGLHTIADLRRVPRDGLGRRFGPVVLDEFDRATGRAPDAREAIALPPVFESRLELFARVENGEQLLHGASVLLARLVAWLSAQHAFVRRYSLVMEHERRLRRAEETPASTTLEIALAKPARDAAHLLALLRERLLPMTLPAPTMDLRLHAADVVRRPPPNVELFPTAASDQEGLVRLVERLQARLGREQILRLAAVDDHRPERATISLPSDAPPAGATTGSAAVPIAGAGATVRSGARTRNLAHAAAASAGLSPGRLMAARALGPASSRAVRPIWLLEPPEPLRERVVPAETGLQHWPLVDGQPLQLLSGPERIEVGWWSEGDAAERDYFIAQKPDGTLVWVYRERVPQPEAPCGWFLQGRFG